MNPAEEPDKLPTVPMSMNDLAALRSILSGYLAYLRRTTLRTQERQQLMQLLQGVYQRLAGISAQAIEVHIVLSVAEVKAVNTAMLGFAAFVRQKVPPSRERDETSETVEQLRQHVMRMLPENDK